MLGHYISIALRNLRKNTLFSLINVAGLACGMAACILIFLYLQWEWSFDRFHTQGDRIYRILLVDHAVDASVGRVALVQPALGPEAAAAFPEIEDYCRVMTFSRELLTLDSSRQMYVAPLYSADSTFFSFFSFPLLRGDPQQVLAKPFSMVLSASVAQRMFGNSNPVGRTVRTTLGDDFTITGICQDPPQNSQLVFEAVTSLSTQRILVTHPQPDNPYPPTQLNSWQQIAMPTYLRLAPGASWRNLEPKLTGLMNTKTAYPKLEVGLQKLWDVHLHSTRIFHDRSAHKGDAAAAYILAAVAVLILVIASVNFVNLSTVCSVSRAREVGLRKAAGATRRQLMMQFLGESLVLSLLATMLAFSIAELTLPWLNRLIGGHLTLHPLSNFALIAGAVVMFLAVGLGAGSYPAAVLSGFQPVEVLKGSYKHSRRGRNLRRALVVFQFTLAIALICATLTVDRQLNFIHTKDLGYSRENVVLIEVNNRQLRGTAHALQSELNASPHVIATGMSNTVPGRGSPRAGLTLEDDPQCKPHMWNLVNVDFDALETMQLKLLSGRDFSKSLPSDTAESIVINEAAARDLGQGDPLGRRIVLEDGSRWNVIGVVKDYHSGTLREKIEPLMFGVTYFPLPTLLVRIKAGHDADALSDIERAWEKLNPGVPLSYQFMDDMFDQAYQDDANFARIINAFSALTVIIACLGLFGLVSHTAEQRRKEIGIRKVLGASVPEICRQLVVEYLRWVALANLLAWPLAYFLTRRWLEGFAYHTNVTWIPFVLAGVLSLAVALVTVLAHALKAASANPATTLRYE